MKESTRNLLVGFFVIISLLVLGVLMVAFGEAPSWLGGSEWTLRITGVDGMSGVGAGSPVNMNGVEIGRVKSLEFKDPNRPDKGVNIVTGIKNTYSVPARAVARVYGATLGFGSGRIDIVLDPDLVSEPIDREFAVIGGEMRSVIGELISKDLVADIQRAIVHIGDVAEAAGPVARNLELLLERRSVANVDQPGAAAQGMTANLATIIQRIDTLVANVNEVLGDENVQGDLKIAVTDVKTAMGELREGATLLKAEAQRTADNFNAGIEHADKNLTQFFAKLTGVLDKLDDASTSMALVLRNIEAGEGTAGRFARDPRMYEAGVLSLERLAELIATVQRIVGKAEEDGYIKVGQATSIGTFKANVATGKVAAKVLAKLAGTDDGTPLITPEEPQPKAGAPTQQ